MGARDFGMGARSTGIGARVASELIPLPARTCIIRNFYIQDPSDRILYVFKSLKPWYKF